jgi:transposase-like protein
MPVVTEEKPTPARRRRRYPKEFRRDVCALVLDQKRSVTDVAKELDLVEHITRESWSALMKLSQGGDMPRSTNAMVSGAPQSRQSGAVNGLPLEWW